jgi:hypothetical protein
MFFHIIRLSIIAFLLHASVTVVSAENQSVSLDVHAPKHGDVAGVGSRAFLVDLVHTLRGISRQQTRRLNSQGQAPKPTNPHSPVPSGSAPTLIISQALSCCSPAPPWGPVLAKT